MPKAGINLFDLLPVPQQANILIPQEVRDFLQKLTIIEHRSLTTKDTQIHLGVVQSLEEVGLSSLKKWPLKIPGLNTGLKFRLLFKRKKLKENQNLEPSPEEFQLDLFLERFLIKIPGLRAAKLIESDIEPAYLVKDPKKKDVYLYGSGVLRIESDPENGIKFPPRLIDWPDPFDPYAPTGCIFNAGFDPPHFFIGSSQFGGTVDKLVIDVSEEYTPPEIVARGHAASWEGLGIQEATLYLPPETPLIQHVSAGVKNLLLGDPLGLQGEIHLAFGKVALDIKNINLVQFKQKIKENGQEQERDLTTIQGEGRSFTVSFEGTQDKALVKASIAPNTKIGNEWILKSGKWVLPDRKEPLEDKDTGYFEVKEGDILKVSPIVTEITESDNQKSEKTELPLPEITYVFKKEQDLQHAPKIKLSLNGNTFTNVVHLSGAPEFFKGLTFEADGQFSENDLKWRLTRRKEVLKEGSGSSFSLDQTLQSNNTFFVVLESQEKKRRVAIEVLSEGKLIIGCENEAFDSEQNKIEIVEVERTYDLNRFHQEGEQVILTDKEAYLSEDNSLSVPKGALAEVVLKLGSPNSPDEEIELPPPTEIRHVQVFMNFNSTDVRIGIKHPYQSEDQEVKSFKNYNELREWVESFEDATFVIIGRCCNCGSQSVNKRLAEERAKDVQKEIKGQKVCAKGEQSNWLDPNECNGLDLNSIPHNGWLILDEQQGNSKLNAAIPGGCPNRESEPDIEAIRKLYRRVDIHAIGGQISEENESKVLSSQDEEKRSPYRRRIMIPGKDLTEIKAIKPREATLPWEAKLKIVWDSPTTIEWKDAIPTLAELTVKWQSKEMNLPNNNSITPTAEIFTLILRWGYDALTGNTLISGSLESSGDSDGLCKLSEQHLSGALALAPALVAGLEAANDGGDAVGLAALVMAAGAATFFAGDGSKTILKKVEIQYEAPDIESFQGSTTRFLVDYTVELHVDLTALNNIGIKTKPKKPIRIRYKNVGIEYTYKEERPWYEGFNLVYEDVSIEIEDPGQWEITGPLGQLLRVTAARAGSGSNWYELDLAFALDLGVISISGATIRITFDGENIDLELRGLSVGINIPGTLKGEGRMALDSDGTVKAGLDLDIIPANIKGKGALALDPEKGFVAIYAGCIFATGIPLASTGLGIFGFEGCFVSNGTRDFSKVTSLDPVQKERDWYLLSSENQYTPQPNQWALGLGTVVGTLPDTAFTFNANGAFVVEFPDPSVIFGITARFASKPSFEKKKTNLLGIISLNPEALILGIKGSYEIEKILKLEVPISGYFPSSNSNTNKDFYLRIGADGYEGRTGDPVTLIFLPDILDAKAWAYLMIEEKQLRNLGGKEEFSFDGFSIGYGCGWDLKWKAGPIKLEATANFLAGLGTDPFILKGGVWVRGELSLVVVSISAGGEIVIQIFEAGDDLLHRLSGKFCGKVDLFFFSIEGCVSIEIGNEEFEIPPPPSPIKGIDLTDRRGVVTGKAKKDSESDEIPTVWPDTVPVIHFSHHVQGDNLSSAFKVPKPPAGEVWFGSGDIKYAYRLVDIQIIPIDDDGTLGDPLNGPFEAVWWWPTHRGGVLNSEDPAPSQHEGLDLALFSWHPAPWARNLLDGASGINGDPVRTIEEICNPSPEPKSICVLGRNAERLKIDRVRLKPDKRKEPPLASYFEIIGREYFYSFDLETLKAFVFGQGVQVVRGQVSSIPSSFEIEEASINKVFELPYLAFQDQFLTTLHFEGQFSPFVEQPDLILVLHEKRDEMEFCEKFSDIKNTRLPSIFRHGPFLYESLDDKSVGVIYKGHLMFNKKGIRITLPYPTEFVKLAFIQDSQRHPVVVKAFDIRGEKVELTRKQEKESKFTYEFEGHLIQKITIEGGAGESRLINLCLQKLDFPKVNGLNSADQTYPWEPELLLEQGPCRFVRYRPKDAQRWKAFRIDPWTGSHLGIVSSCALTWKVIEKYVADQQAREEFVKQWNERAEEEAPSEHRFLLDPDKTYQIKIKWQWQACNDGGKDSPQDDKWSDSVEEIFIFHTAPKGEISPGTPPDSSEETVFDPRGILRYLIKIEPEDNSAFHFLDDPIQVHFQIDYIEQLLNLYGYELVFRLRRTDPPVGSLKDQAHPPDVPLNIEWQPLAEKLLDLSDRHILEAVKQSPCLEEIPLGGKTAEIYAQLEPHAEYDLMLLACSENEEILLTRTHFRTSRYRNPSEMMKDLGFSMNEPDPIYPMDIVLEDEEDSQMPTDEILESDCDFENTLRALGLDPWPLPQRARTIALWKKGNENWEFQGLLLETLEPLFRGERISFGSAVINNGNQPIELSLVRSNTSNTRLLLIPPTPSELNGETILEISWLENGQVVTASKYLRDTPAVF